MKTFLKPVFSEIADSGQNLAQTPQPRQAPSSRWATPSSLRAMASVGHHSAGTTSRASIHIDHREVVGGIDHRQGSIPPDSQGIAAILIQGLVNRNDPVGLTVGRLFGRHGPVHSRSCGEEGHQRVVMVLGLVPKFRKQPLEQHGELFFRLAAGQHAHEFIRHCNHRFYILIPSSIVCSTIAIVFNTIITFMAWDRING